mmetsp:Transcript_64111/g.173059  ORF Transcript_64111/g.173059 Transcript_64111/m.173059 type:complete len:204 (+) Transcript_64111:159-770(+)
MSTQTTAWQAGACVTCCSGLRHERLVGWLPFAGFTTAPAATNRERSPRATRWSVDRPSKPHSGSPVSMSQTPTRPSEPALTRCRTCSQESSAAAAGNDTARLHTAPAWRRGKQTASSSGCHRSIWPPARPSSSEPDASSHARAEIAAPSASRGGACTTWAAQPPPSPSEKSCTNEPSSSPAYARPPPAPSAHRASAGAWSWRV